MASSFYFSSPSDEGKALTEVRFESLKKRADELAGAVMKLAQKRSEHAEST